MGHFEELPGVWVNSDYKDTAANYLASNPDVAADPYFSARPLEHWERYGKNENRNWGAAPTTEESSGGGDGGSGGGEVAMMPRAVPTVQAPVAPTMGELPTLTMSKGASVTNQLAKLQSIDSIPMQQAKINAQETGAATGAIHSSQQGGAAQRAVQNAMTPLAQSEANLVGNTDIANWQNETKKVVDVYEKEYAGYLAKLGIDSSQKIAMLQANTTLSTAMMSSVTSLLNNPEIEYGQGVQDKLSSIFNTGLSNNNTILGMGFTYA